MKIISGRLKGKILETRNDKGLRPTKGYIREMIFNLLMHGRFQFTDDFIHDENPSLIQDRRVLDIFCGTGALGLEALSRGAAHVTLIDQNAATVAVLQENVRRLGEQSNVTVLRSDSTQLPSAALPHDLVFIDPPYQKGLVFPALNTLISGKWVKHGTVVIVEQDKRDEVKLPEKFTLCDDRAHDKTRTLVLQYRNA